jgi:hypothetical protein
MPLAICIQNVYTRKQADVDFEWDERKNAANVAEHGISFQGAAHIFDGPVMEYVDSRRYYGETRIAAIGVLGRTELCVVYTIRGGACRIISARRANQNERRSYRQIFPR